MYEDNSYSTISKTADIIGVQSHVLRFWEKKFPQLKPMKRGGNRRYYRRCDIDFLLALRKLLYQDRYTIKGVQKLIRENNFKLEEISNSPKSDKNSKFSASISEIILDLQNSRNIINQKFE